MLEDDRSLDKYLRQPEAFVSFESPNILLGSVEKSSSSFSASWCCSDAIVAVRPALKSSNGTGTEALCFSVAMDGYVDILDGPRTERDGP
jgi:hypothetical protein